MSYDNGVPVHSVGEACPACNYDYSPKGGKLRLIKTRDGSRVFLGCTRYPDCKYTVSSHYTSENIDLQIERELEEEERQEQRNLNGETI